jgi:dTDP-4-dehydrorhamnose reductase
MKLLVIGSAGRLGAALVREYQGKFDVNGFNRAQLDLSNFDKICEKLGGTDFDVLINAAAFTNVDLCETQPDQAFRINAGTPGILAKICCDKGAKLIHFSTDYVFDGEKRAPYREEDEANPISIYGESKLAGEKNVLTAQNRPASRPEGSRLIQPAGSPSSFNSRSSTLDVPSVEGAACRGQVRRHLVVRVSWVFGPDRPSFIDGMIKRAQENEKVDAIADKFSTPTYTYDIAKMLPQFFDGDIEGGILHFANAGKCSWQEYAQWALDCCREFGVPTKARTVGALKLNDMTRLGRGNGGQAAWVARRPVYSVLSTARYVQLTGTPPRTWREAVADYIRRFYSKK